MEVESVLVTGANRGIGLEFVKQFVKLAKPPRFVFATYRDEDTTQALKEIQDATKDTQVVLIKMDVTKTDDIQNGRKVVESKLGDGGLQLLINNAGYLKRQAFTEMTEENLFSHFSINAAGPIIVLKEMLPLLRKSAARKSSGLSLSRAAVLNISSMGGSIGRLSKLTPEQYMDSILSYKTSKAALNMAMRVISLQVKDQGILIANMCPGWVRTDMGTPEAWLSPEESTTAMLHTLTQLDESHQGAFMERNGNPILF